MNDIIINLREEWNNEGCTYTRGSAFLEEKLLKGVELTEYIENSTEKDKKKLIEKLNGFFSVIQKNSEGIFIAVDRIRSIPLFYAKKEEEYLISDDPYWIKENIENNKFDELSKNELLLTGYVTGSDTLYKDIKQMRAGEILYIKNNELTTDKYYELFNNDYFYCSKKELLKKHHEVLLKAFKRLINYADGRTIVIPLSGGYDSRLVATMLKNLDYKNVITFSYGKFNSPEAVISKQVAENLGFKWLFILYDNDKTYEWYNSEERKMYGKMADNLCSTCIDREWPAVWELKRNNMIPKDAIFVPGHSGDFIGGNFIPFELYKKESISGEEIFEVILKKCYVMLNWKGKETVLKEQFANKFLKREGIEKFDLCDDAINIYERWIWQELQVKHMVNPIRIYDFWGYEWWMPLWDAGYIEYWSKIPLKWRIGKKLYDEYVTQFYSHIAGIKIQEAVKRYPTKNIDLKSILKRKVKESFIGPLARKFYKKISTNNSTMLVLKEEEKFDTDWEQCFGRINKNLYNELLPYIVGRGSVLSLERLGYISYTDDKASLELIEMLKKLMG